MGNEKKNKREKSVWQKPEGIKTKKNAEGRRIKNSQW